MTERDNTPNPPLAWTQVSRRGFLRYVGTGAAAVLGAGQLGALAGCATGTSGWVRRDGTPAWQPPAYPLPLPGDPHPAAEDSVRFASFQVVDGLTLPEGFRSDVVARWGESFGAPDHRITFGYNNDFTGLVRVAGSDDEYWLMVNHEYVSYRPWSAAAAEDGQDLPYLTLRYDPERYFFSRGVVTVKPSRAAAEKWQLPPDASWELDQGHYINVGTEEQRAEIPEWVLDDAKRLSDAGLAEQGVSVLRVRRGADGGLRVVANAPDHRRIATASTQNVGLDADGRPPFRFTGPAASLLGRPRGTFCNCSGGVTPWGTFLTCEENFQYQVNEEVSPAGQLLPGRRMRFGGSPTRINGEVVEPAPEPSSLDGMGYAIDEPLDGREYGWVTEIDPVTGSLAKHTALGRFRHENVAVRAEAGARLAAYMGDDRRGGHVWKFVSEGKVTDPGDPGNSRLFEKGTLYVAHFQAAANGEGGTGRWVALEPRTPLRRPEPEHCPSSHVHVANRPAGGYVEIGDTDRDYPAIEVDDWLERVAEYAGKPFAECTLGDLVRPEGASEADDEEVRRGILAMDAFVMANAVGGTPTARPEDLEVHPADSSVYIAFTDATDSSDGSPDTRVFPDSRRDTSRQYGAIYRLVEDGDDPAAETFTWGKFVSSGEIAEQGGGFANADNLVFDPEGNLWMVSDISTSAQNFPVTGGDELDGTRPGEKQFPGVFGNNAMFMIPTRGPKAGVPHLFAIGPTECEMCGPTFTEDGKTLILSIQHPGELRGTRSAEVPSETRRQVIHDRNGKAFEQEREVPLGSNYPSGKLGEAPRPCVVCITRTGDAA